MLESGMPVTDGLSLTIKVEMKEIFLRLGVSLTMAHKLVEDKGIDTT